MTWGPGEPLEATRTVLGLGPGQRPAVISVWYYGWTQPRMTLRPHAVTEVTPVGHIGSRRGYISWSSSPPPIPVVRTPPVPPTEGMNGSSEQNGWSPTFPVAKGQRPVVQVWGPLNSGPPYIVPSAPLFCCPRGLQREPELAGGAGRAATSVAASRAGPPRREQLVGPGSCVGSLLWVAQWGGAGGGAGGGRPSPCWTSRNCRPEPRSLD